MTNEEANEAATPLTDEQDRQKGLIVAACAALGLNPDGWRQGEDGYEAVIGRWTVVADTEMLLEGDAGELTCCVVGAPEHGNERASFWLTPDGMDSPEEVVPFEDVQPV